MPSFGLLGLLDALQAGLGRMAPGGDGEPESRQLAPLWRAAGWFKLLLVPLVFAIVLRWPELFSLLLCLGGLYLATEALCALLAPGHLAALLAPRHLAARLRARWQPESPVIPVDGAMPPACTLDRVLRSEAILSGSVLLLCAEQLLHLPPAVVLPLLILVALLLQLGIYGPIMALLQLGALGRAQVVAGAGRRGRRLLRLAAGLLGMLLRVGSLAMLLLGGSMVLGHLPGLDALLGYLQMEFGLYGLQGLWLWPLYGGLGLLAGLWGRWLLTVRGYFAPVKPATVRVINKKDSKINGI